MQIAPTQTVNSTRPKEVEVTTALMAGILLLETASIPSSISRFRAIGTGFHAASSVAGAVSIISILIAAVFIFFYWKGQNVARWAVLIDSGYVLLSALLSIFTWRLAFHMHLMSSTLVYLSLGLTLLKSCLAVYFFWFLNQPAIKQWFLLSSASGAAPAGGTPYMAQPYAASESSTVATQAEASLNGKPFVPAEQPPAPGSPPPTDSGFTV